MLATPSNALKHHVPSTTPGSVALASQGHGSMDHDPQTSVIGHGSVADLYARVQGKNLSVVLIELPIATQHLWDVLIGDSGELWGAKVSWTYSNTVTITDSHGTHTVYPWGKRWNLPVKGLNHGL